MTITNTPKTGAELKATKTWVFGPKADHTADNITITLYQNGKAIADNQADSAIKPAVSPATPGADTYTYHWTNLAAHDAEGYPFVYTVDETGGPAHYDKQVSEDGLHFTNTYTIPDETSIQITASKTYNGGELDAGEFVFRLSGAGDQLIEEKKNAADGSVTFTPLTITQEGTYRYTLAEVAGKAEGVTYDTRVYTLTYEVMVDTQNRLQAILSEVKQDGGILPTDAKLVFENTYAAPTADPTATPTPTASPDPTATPAPIVTDPTTPTYPTIRVPLSAKKELKNGSLKADAFTFQLKDKSGKVLAEVKNAAGGALRSNAFHAFSLTASIACKRKFPFLQTDKVSADTLSLQKSLRFGRLSQLLIKC